MNGDKMKPLKIKNGVHINGRHFDHDIRIMLDIARITSPALEDDTVWVTSANDSKHMTTSKHYSNEAFDIRTRNLINSEDAKIWVFRMQENLGDDYDVVLERDHLHLEKDVK